MLRLATIECRDPFMRWTKNHVLHPGLGVDKADELCVTCSKNVYNCPGHYGFIRLEKPVFHVGFLLCIVRILRCICKLCGRVLLSDARLNQYAARYRNPRGLAFSQRKALFGKVFNEASRVYICPHCSSINGKVSRIKTGALRIVHQPSAKHLKQLPKGGHCHGRHGFGEASRYHGPLVSQANSMLQELTPEVVHALLSKMPNKDVLVLDMHPESRPEWMILTHIHVPPKVVRPSPPPLTSGGVRHDDLTVLLNDVLVACNELRRHHVRGGTTQKHYELWDTLQISVARLIDDQLPNFPRTVRDKFAGQLTSYVGRLKGKGGRFRNTLSGKRVNFSGRSVISPDPNLSIHEVALPIQIAQRLTFPQHVTGQNIDASRELVRRGPDVYPGANFIISVSTGEKRHLKHNYVSRQEIATRLQIGDVIERHIINGDTIVFNRQPSLHRLSMMCHVARVLPYRTLRFNECVCQPYNADFDGDEMNIHVPQTLEARAEALTLMSATQNLFSARNGCPIIAPLQDFLTGSFLLTKRDLFFSRLEITQIVAYFTSGFQDHLPTPVVIKPQELWTGKQLIQLLVRNPQNFSHRRENRAQNEAATFTFSNKLGSSAAEAFNSVNDDNIHFYNNELLTGRLEKSTMGSGERAKCGYFHHIKKELGLEYAAECMGRLSKLTSRFLMEYGFSIGIDDVAPNADLHDTSRGIVRDGFRKAEELIEMYTKGHLFRRSGCTIEETLEKEIKGVLSEVRDMCGRLCIDSLHPSNAPLIMAKCGSKGSVLNISQMVVCVGQQIVNERRIDDHFSHRCTPHLPQKSREARARGFVENSFYSGLTPLEFVFHTMAGREGLVQSSIKTAQTGYLGRRIMKVLEDLTIQYDYTVRNADGCVVQLRYGEDSLDPLKFDPERLEYRREWDWFVSVESNIVRNPSEAHLEALVGILHKFQSNPQGCFLTQNFIQSVHTFCHSEFAQRRSVFISCAAFELFLKALNRKYTSFMCEPGTPCGVIAAQSLSEPTTQMTLRTFHFAGVSGMSVTQGVPRIEEIMDARRSISTPFVMLSLKDPRSLQAAKCMKASIERTYLYEVVKSITHVISSECCSIEVKFCPSLLRSRRIDFSVEKMRAAMGKTVRAQRLGLNADKISSLDEYTLVIAISSPTADADINENVDQIVTLIKGIVVGGIQTCAHALIRNTADKTSDPCYEIIVDTDDYKNLIVLDGVDANHSTCNHVASIEATLGIEAARTVIINEILAVMRVYALTVDVRHVMLLADAMTARGLVLGTTNAGLSKDRDSVLKLASFERTQEHIFNAASKYRCDSYLGISECIMLGLPAKIGTNLFGLLDTRGNKTYAEDITHSSSALGDFWNSVKTKVS
ncbi:hypothetical protein XU18_2865 [Perkinsela sp. CCAP 1560/4]|nr:hypothetical protein XU18_2865 [Perkinsela sp. CCAP 1560/4]|eukprot:KNH06360.1 hypothetical protein XU18_2865 [Perkinsela sp. CCAP 1560/4]